MKDQRSIPYPFDIQKTSQKKRYHKDVNYESSPMALNVFSIYQICDLACSSDYIVQKHRQICHEISYIVSGEGTFYRNEKAYAVSPNTIFLVNVHDVHSITSAKNAPLRFMCLGFIFHKDHPDYPKYEHIDRFFDTLQDPMVPDKNNLFGLFSLALNEVSSYDPLSGEMFESYVRQIIIQTYRNFTLIPRHHIDLADINDTNPLLYEITNYIDTNLTNIKHLADISSVFDYSYGYLSRTFSQVMGITIKDYYTQRRLERAADLLAQGISISQVSEQLQFADIPSFYKVFKRYYHVSPRKYQVMINEKPELEEKSDPKI
ncbi:AraC family transcriptional regulator [bacterium D16-50]|nr:AraC family transcriptional regulator [bacterium D16-50]